MFSGWKSSCKAHSALRDFLISLFPEDEQNKQHEQLSSVESYTDGFKEKSTQWLNKVESCVDPEESGFVPRSSDVLFFQMDNSLQVIIKANGPVTSQGSQEDVNPNDSTSDVPSRRSAERSGKEWNL